MTTKTKSISSVSYLLGITKADFINDFFKVILNILRNNVTDPKSGARKNDKFWYSTFPDVDISDDNTIAQTCYPIGILESPDSMWEKLTMTKKNHSGSFDVEIFSTKKEEADDLINQAINGIESNRTTLRSLKTVMVNLDRMDNRHFMHGSKRIHNRVATFAFKYSWVSSL